MGKFRETESNKGAALQHLLGVGGSRRDPDDSHTVYVEEDDDINKMDGGVTGSILNGKTLMALGSATPNHPSAYLFRKNFSTKVSRRGIRKRVVFKVRLNLYSRFQ